MPKTHTNTKIQRNRRSITMATYFQSSLTCEIKRTADEKGVEGWMDGWIERTVLLFLAKTKTIKVNSDESY